MAKTKSDPSPADGTSAGPTPKPAKPRQKKSRPRLRLAGMRTESTGKAEASVGSTPGIESVVGVDQQPSPGEIRIRSIDYSPDVFEEREFGTIDECIAAARTPGAAIRWINVDGLNPYVVNQLRKFLGFHTLAAEDVLRTPQRPKMEPYEGHLSIIARMLMWKDEQLHHEQLSIFLFKDTVLTFQETEGDCWDPIRLRIQKPGSRLRTLDSSYLVYAMLDAVVDHCFPILENYGEVLEQLEAAVLEDPSPRVQQRLHAVKRELAVLRRVIWPLRELVRELHHEDTEAISKAVKAYMRDVYDHAVQIMDIVETYREMAGGLNDLYMSAVSNRMNEIMKVLTIMASVFIPVTFVAGVYGMNFEHIPELGWKYSYAIFWGICLSIVMGLLIFFWRRGWIGGGGKDES
ncbi:MAG TPA: magnesium/cobalt transporter CorA [Opitutaceae bacterium]|nr:magnesium/cobalt transporter CorA [Opitutaceae bacterium]